MKPMNLNRNLGSLSEKAWLIWNKGTGENIRSKSSFFNDLNEFNNRRRFIMASNGELINGGHKNFLFAKFRLFHDSDFLKVASLNPELFLGSKADFIFMNFVYLRVHRFDLSNL